MFTFGLRIYNITHPDQRHLRVQKSFKSNEAPKLINASGNLSHLSRAESSDDLVVMALTLNAAVNVTRTLCSCARDRFGQCIRAASVWWS